MSSDIVIRFADPTDRRELRAMQALSFRTLGAPYYDGEVIDAFLASVGTMDDTLLHDGTFLAAVQGDRIVGCGGWSSRTPGYSSRIAGGPAPAPLRQATVRSIFVHPDFARRGIASAIMAAVEAEIAATNFGTAALTSTLSAIPLYRRLGYRGGTRTVLYLQGGLTFVGLGMAKQMLRASIERDVAA